ncbi:MAG TPA: DUF4402 domain-containing protein [Alphaproteobacteria bacterium]|nr:DUF4402 domain-containing protein [Alphaproteobacteria bacterium]USO06285.1 MAG: DUF4402 domain-containing protein [Rhodospirillales bacterium]HOO81110.1 DUF4402 domain-containing protein [Alphaproteobacteria bacterium]
MDILSEKILLRAITVLAVGSAQAAYAATGSVPIQAAVHGALAITQTRTLNFGSITDSGAGGTINVDNSDTPTVGGGVTSYGGTITSGGFTLRGTPGRQIDVTAPTSVVISNGAAATMTVGLFTINGAAGTINATAFTHILTVLTQTGFRLGGTLNVNPGQAAGTYTGTVNLTGNYN